MFGCGLLLILLALVTSLQAAPALPPPTTDPDLRLAMQEDFFNRFVQSASAQNVTVDVLPGNRIRVTLDTTVSAFGTTTPIQVVPVFGVQAAGSALEIRLIDMQIVGIPLTPELRDSISSNLPDLNQNANRMLGELSQALGAPLVITGLGTGDRELWLEAREGP
jgi:hypothetical protein